MKRHLFLGVAAIGLAACTGAANSGSGVRITDTTIEFETGDFEIPEGESFECFYTNVVTEQEYIVDGANAAQAVGGHHLVVYYNTLDPVLPASHHPCEDSEMAGWRQVAAGGGETTGEADDYLSEGLGLRIPAGVQLVLQAHYINTDGARKVNDKITLTRVPPEVSVIIANAFAVVDTDWTIPPNGGLTRTDECTIPHALDISMVLGHMHEAGRHYTLEMVDPQDNATILYDQEWAALYASHPPFIKYPVSAPLHLPAGTRLRQTCTWQNDSAEPIYFPTEMCIAFMYYFPDTGDGMINCF